MKINSLYPVIMTEDVAKSKAFWTANFFFKVAFDSEWYVSLKTDQQPAFELAFLDPDHPTVPEAFRGKFKGGLIVNLEVDDVDAEYERLRKIGLPMHLPLRSEDFGQRHFITSDPNGVLIDVIKVIPPSADYESQYDEETLVTISTNASDKA
ncbi:VOC family protein [Acinetobacter towneri]|uniref:Glyoxalase n=1 Tax=Acinetobacter towneri TaxID=202956 RepID=A0A1E8E2C5_9GAMM|nr:VOC family protein [Acinetobacter towneri]OFE43821.1 glyoxalase [Acinetobacter towneri]